MSLANKFDEDFETSKWETMEALDVDKLEEIDENVQVNFTNEYSLDKPVYHIAKLFESDKLSSLINEINSYKTIGLKQNAFTSIEANPEYQLIVKSNDIITEIDNDINVIHKYVKDIYTVRFPELSTIVPDPIQYFKSIKLIGNNVRDISKMKDKFDFLASAEFLVLSVSSSSGPGEILPYNRLDNVIDACSNGLYLQEKKDQILQFVESRMPYFAPNLSALVGAPVAAKLIGYKGGLRGLADTPGCNILNIGAPRKSEAHVGINSNTPKGCGYIYWIDFIQRIPKEFRKKAGKQFANKAVMSARCDLGPDFRDGQRGREFLARIEKTVEKWMEPPPVKLVKALPAPIDLPSKRRGGRRYRKRKERLGMTEVRKSANRMEFGGILEESYDNEMSVNAGRLGRTNKIRLAQADPKTKSRVSKTLNQKLQKQNQITSSFHSGGTTTIKKQVGGTSTSVAFTPSQGIEITNPHMLETKKAESAKYF